MEILHLRAVAGALLITAVLLPNGASAQEAGALLKRASEAMGAGHLSSLRYSGEGTGYSFGQAYSPGKPWPKISVHS